MIRDLHRDMGALSSSGSWYVLLINSVSHGVFNVVERMDEEFFASHLGPGQYDIIRLETPCSVAPGKAGMN